MGMRMRTLALILASSSLLWPRTVAATDPPPRWTPFEGASLVGKPAPEWQGLKWLDGPPLTLRALRGKVVLIRFWTAGCSLCEHSLPSLAKLDRELGPRGLVVLGVHHPKEESTRDPALVRRAARASGVTFPVALDETWSTVRAYGVGREFTRFTSVTVLVDRRGVIRWVHPGGELNPDEGAAWASLLSSLESTLGSPP